MARGSGGGHFLCLCRSLGHTVTIIMQIWIYSVDSTWTQHLFIVSTHYAE